MRILLRGYCSIRSLELNEEVQNMRNNPHNQYAINQATALKQWPGFLGEHLPRKVCRFTNYIIFHGGVTAKAVDVNLYLFFHYKCAYSIIAYTKYSDF